MDQISLEDTATSEALSLDVEQCKLSAMFPTYLKVLTFDQKLALKQPDALVTAASFGTGPICCMTLIAEDIHRAAWDYVAKSRVDRKEEDAKGGSNCVSGKVEQNLPRGIP